MMSLDAPGSVTDFQISLALQDLHDICEDGLFRPHALNELLRKEATPAWMVNLAATVVGKTGKAGVMVDTMVLLQWQKPDLPLPLQAGLCRVPGYESFAHWMTDGMLDPHYQEMVKQGYPELEGLPVWLLVETLATQPSTDWLAHVPDRFIVDVRDLLDQLNYVSGEE